MPILLQNEQFNYMNFRVSVQVPTLNITHPEEHLLPRPIQHDHTRVHGRNSFTIAVCSFLFVC